VCPAGHEPFTIHQNCLPNFGTFLYLNIMLRTLQTTLALCY
jgi:hypothetical protein